jgi:hypothetical protein
MVGPVGCEHGLEPQKPDEQFVKLLFQYGFRDELNTFNGTLTKDLVLNGTVTVPFWLTKSEQESVLVELARVDFFYLPDTLLRMAGVDISPNSGTQLLRIEVGSQTKTVIWSYLIDPSHPASQRITQLSQAIQGIIESKPEYKQLPPARGGYI